MMVAVVVAVVSRRTTRDSLAGAAAGPMHGRLGVCCDFEAVGQCGEASTGSRIVGLVFRGAYVALVALPREKQPR